MSLDRRRALMMAGREDPTLVYELLNRECPSGTLVSTIRFLSDGFNGTFLLDIDIKENPTTGYGCAYRIAMWDNKFVIGFGKNRSVDGNLSVRWQGSNWNNFSGTTAAPGRKRMAILHSANSPTVKFVFKDGATGQIKTTEQTASMFVPSLNYLCIGSASNDNQSLPLSTINSCRIYSRVLSQSEIDTFFA